MNPSSKLRKNNKFNKTKLKKSQEVVILPQIDHKQNQQQIQKQVIKQEGMLTKLKGFFSGWFTSNQTKPQDNNQPQKNHQQQTKNKQQNTDEKQKRNSPQHHLKNSQEIKPNKLIPTKKQTSPQSKQKMLRLEEIIEKNLFAIHPNKIYPKKTSNPYDIKIVKGASDLPFLSDRFVNIPKIVPVKYRGPANRLDVNAQLSKPAINKGIYKEHSYYSQQRCLNKLPYTLSLPTQNDQSNKIVKNNQNYSQAKKFGENSRIKTINRDILDIINTDFANSSHLQQKQQLIKLGDYSPPNNTYDLNTISQGDYKRKNSKKRDKYLLKHSRQLYNSRSGERSYANNKQEVNLNYQQRKTILKSTPKYSRAHYNK